MKLPDISTKIKRLASLDMPVEALKVLLSDLAAELDRVEARLSKDRRLLDRSENPRTYQSPFGPYQCQKNRADYWHKPLRSRQKTE